MILSHPLILCAHVPKVISLLALFFVLKASSMHGQDLIGCCSLCLIVVDMVWPKLSSTRLWDVMNTSYVLHLKIWQLARSAHSK